MQLFIVVFSVVVWLFLQVQFHLMLYIQMQLCERSVKDWIFERNIKPKTEQASKCNCLTHSCYVDDLFQICSST